ncbi:MAG: PAS domain S-box protein [Burkholderiales bacterium]
MEIRDEDELLRAVALENARSIRAVRKQAEAELFAAQDALRESEQRLRAVFDQAAVGIAISELDGRLAETNRKFLAILGYAEGELAGRTAYEITHPDDVAATRANAANLAAGEIPEYSYEKRYIHKDGRTVWTLTSVALLRDLEGRPRQYVGVIEDITARKDAEQALAEETRILELLNRTGAAIAAEVDLHAIVQRVTDAATQLSGAKFGAFFYNVVGKDGEAYQLYTLSGAPREAFDKLGLPRNTPVFGPTFRGEGVVRSEDITKDPRYGTMAPHQGMPKGHLSVRSYLAVPVMSRDGSVIGGLFFGHSEPGVFTERAERLVLGVAGQAGTAIDNARLFEERTLLLEREREARAQAERMSEVKDEFLATLSHELRTPLSAILGWSQVIASRPMAAEELKRAVQVIERNARAQTRLIEDLLDMSRITSGQVRLDVQAIDPAALVDGAVETVRPAAEAKGIRLEKLLDPKAGPIYGDPGRLQQVLWNLVSNAIKFTPKGGKVQVVLQRVNSHIEVSVADTGIGIRAEFLPHVFDRFRQADGSTTRRHGGLGLGLAIAKHLVELHGGALHAASPGEDGGATFTMHLPLMVVHARSPKEERAHPTVAAGPPAPSPLPNLTGLTVLAVDDEADARELIRRVLQDCGAQVVTAGSVAEALVLFERERPDLVVSDIGMPVADGFELLKRLRELGREHGGNVPAIALTAFARAEDRMKVLRAGFQMHVSKPVEAAELCIAVANVAGRAG